MQDISIGDEAHAKARKSSNGYVVVIQDSELLIRNDSNVTTGDYVTVRVVGPNSVAILNESDYTKQGLPGELFAIVDHCPDHYPSKVRCIEDPFVGEQWVVEELESEEDKIIPVLPLDAIAEDRAAICTSPSLWPGERVGERSEYSYSDELMECFDNSETVSPDRVEKLKGLIAKTKTVKQAELRLTETDFIAPKAVEQVSNNTHSISNDEDINQPPVDRQSSGRENVNRDCDKTQQTQDDLDQEEPPLSDSEVSYTTTRQRQRDANFTRKVKSAYNETCAICGKRRVTPDGKTEVEAAHIYPKSEGGADHVRNGLALCKFHHWAFDHGWISLKEDYRIIVADHPNQDGYEDLKNFDSKKLNLPEKEAHKPHVKFIREHQKIHGFEQ